MSWEAMEVSMSKTRRGKYTDNRICYISKCKGDMRLYLRRKGKLSCFSYLVRGKSFSFYRGKIREEQERDQKAMKVIQRVQQKDSPVYESVNNESISRSQIDTSLEEHSKVTVAEDGPTAAPTSMDKGIDAEEKSNKKGWFRKIFWKK